MAQFGGGGGGTKIDRTFDPAFLVEFEHAHGYTYTNIKFPESVIWTLGVSYDDFQRDPVEVRKVNPKVGVRWDMTNNISLRGAFFRWVKPPLTANRSLEPTQVSGFDQVFDDGNGDESWRRGVGLDWRITKQLFVGAEATWRDTDIPIISFGLDGPIAVFETWKEQLHRAYVFWTPSANLSLSAQAVYDTFEAEKGLLTPSGDPPEYVRTFCVPLGARYFAPNGVFAGLGVTYVNQEVIRSAEAIDFGFSDGREAFFVWDAAIGWRFPKRFGIASLTVKNLFDEAFLYQDDNFREFRQEGPSTGPYIPERQVVGRVNLYF